MSKPVEIEFLMKDNLSGGLDKTGQSVDKLIDRAKAAAEAINVKIAEQHKVIDGVSADLNRMERQLAGMKPGTAQRELAADVAACRKVLNEERGALQELEKQHKQAELAVNDLAKEHNNLASSEEKASASQLSLAERIAESKALIKGTQADIKELEKAYKNAAPGNAQNAAYAELNAAKKALEEEKVILASLTAEQERNKESNKRLSMQLRELQDAMAKMRLEGRQDSEEYRKMAAEAANLSDTIADLRTQTKILSNDDANLQGFMSGMSGLAGMFTTATGALSLFASENENLAKVQARVQSVMAITMGLQQVFNTLNKDSAFRLVTVVKMKNLLTAANARLATSLGISTVAAQALMATLTLGLSAVITGLIVLWNKYSDAQDEAARKAQEMVEIESDGRAQMIKTRFELDNTIASLKEFSGSKEEEKKKTDELNRKYGEAFGYYDTVAEWYDVLIQKSSDYIQMLFLQAKAQAMVNKAVEADDKLNKIKATDQNDVEGSMGWFRKSLLYFAQSSEPSVQFDAKDAIDSYNKNAKDKAIKNAQAERDNYLRQAEELTKQAAQVGKTSNIGGHTKPNSPKPTTGKSGKATDPQKEHEREMAAEQQRAQELQQLRWKNEQENISQMADGSERRKRQIKLDYDKEIAEINEQEAKWREAQKGELTKDQSEELKESYRLADKKYADGKTAIDEEQRQAEEQAMRDYLSKYGDYEERRLAITQEYEVRIAEAKTQGEKQTLQKEMEKELSDLDVEKLKDSLDWESVFGDLDKVSTDGLKTLRAQLKDYISTQKNLQPESLKELVRAIDSINETVNERSPFTVLRTTINSLFPALKDVKEAQDAYNKALESGTKEEQKNAEATLNAARNAKQKALAEATDALHNSVGKVKEYVGVAEDMMGLVGQFGIDPPEWLEGYLEGTGQMLDGLESIDLTKPMSVITGGIKALSGAVKQITSLGGLVNWNGSNAKEVQDTINRLTDRNEKLQTSIEDLTDEIKSSKGTKSVAAYRDAYKYQKETNANYLQMAQAQAGYHGDHHSWNYYWGGFSQAQIDKLSSQIGRSWNGDIWNLSPEEMKLLRSNVDMWTQIQNTGKGGYGGRLTEKLDDYIDQAGKLEELTDQLYEGLTGISFDGMYSSFIDNLMDMKYDAKAAAEDISEYFMRAMLSNKIGEMYSDKLKDWWEKFGKAMEDNDLTEAERKALTDEYMKYVDEAIKLRDNLAAATGYAPDGGSTSQSAKAGGFTAMTQDQGTKLEGMFTSGLQHWSSMDDNMENVSDKMNSAENHLAKIEENTGKSADHLEKIAENIVKIIRDGLKVK